jgi:hypothetical protein
MCCAVSVTIATRRFLVFFALVISSALFVVEDEDHRLGAVSRAKAIGHA